MAPIIALSAVDASFLNSTCCAQPMFSSSGLQLGYFVCSPLLDSAKTASLCHEQCRVRSGSCKVSKPQSRQRVQTGFGQHHLSTETSPKPGVLPCYCANSAVWQWSKNRCKECATVACVARDRQVLVTQFTVAPRAAGKEENKEMFRDIQLLHSAVEQRDNSQAIPP